MHRRILEQAVGVNDYLKGLECEETGREFHRISAGKLLLTPGGLLNVGDRCYELVDEAIKDLAKLARIPASFFEEIEPGLRAINFNARLPQLLGADETLEVAISNDSGVHRVQRPRFGKVLASQAIEALLEGVPDATVSNNIRAVEYERDRRLDVALVAPALEAEPQRGDIVYVVAST
jgi:hypothetical protein